MSRRRPLTADGLAAAHFITHREAAHWRWFSISSWLLGFSLIASVLFGWVVAGHSTFSIAEAFALFAAGMSLGGGVAAGLTARYCGLLADLRAELGGESTSDDSAAGRRDRSDPGPTGAPARE